MATTARRKPKTTNEKGLGWPHRNRREQLLAKLVDGAPCDWDGRPLYRDPTKNWDYKQGVVGSGVLQADHSKMSREEAIEKGLPIPLPDRLLHGECNRQRGNGKNDHLAWINSGKPPVMNDAATDDTPGYLAMPWPRWA